MSDKFGLTLGGGGARGAAHIGVIAELEQVGVYPDLITGTSIGGMIGALLAAGFNAEQLAEFFEKLSIAGMYSLPGTLPAFSNNNKIEKLLQEMIGGITFADLNIPLAIVATDVVQRKPVILDEGDLITAVLATIALPLVLPPVERDGHTLVDGGIMNNVPFDVARARGANFVLAIDLTNTAPYGTTTQNVPTTGNVLERVLNITQRNRTWQMLSTVVDIVTAQSLNTRMAISQPEILLQPDLGTIGILDFHRWEEGVEVGKTAVLPHLDEIIKQTARKL
ncbi:MAG: hypothetical protein DWQ04_04155 [Chloroflexi bacterium]|nr:MAG: hypothetical protein DWQ04_04155 [Chloroflexota bacterium]